MAAHSSVLAWRIPGTVEPGGLRLWGCTESDTTEATRQQQRLDKHGNANFEGFQITHSLNEDSGEAWLLLTLGDNW